MADYDKERRNKAVLFAPDGDWVTDYKGNTKEDVIDQLANRGSLWYFYPFEGIILNRGGVTTPRQRLVSLAPNMPQCFVGATIKFVSRWLGMLSKEKLLTMLEWRHPSTLVKAIEQNSRR